MQNDPEQINIEELLAKLHEREKQRENPLLGITVGTLKVLASAAINALFVWVGAAILGLGWTFTQALDIGLLTFIGNAVIIGVVVLIVGAASLIRS